MINDLQDKLKEANELSRKLAVSLHAQEVLGKEIFDRGSFKLFSVRTNYGKTWLRAYLEYEDGHKHPLTFEQYQLLQECKQ